MARFPSLVELAQKRREAEGVAEARRTMKCMDCKETLHAAGKNGRCPKCIHAAWMRDYRKRKRADKGRTDG